MKVKHLALTLAALLCAAPASAQSTLERIEPAFWWVGMHDHHLQLMVHGAQIAALQPRLDYPGVRILGVQRVANPNYLFLDLEIAPAARAGKFEIVFGRGRQQLRAPYQLKARAPG